MYMHYRVNNIAIVETPKFATFLWICKIDMSVLEDTTHTYTSNMKVCTSGRDLVLPVLNLSTILQKVVNIIYN